MLNKKDETKEFDDEKAKAKPLKLKEIKQDDVDEEEEQERVKPRMTKQLRERGMKLGLPYTDGQDVAAYRKLVDEAEYGIKTNEDRIAVENARKEGAYRERNLDDDGISAEGGAEQSQFEEWLKPYVAKGLTPTYSQGGYELSYGGKTDSGNFTYPKTAVIQQVNRLMQPESQGLPQ